MLVFEQPIYRSVKSRLLGCSLAVLAAAMAGAAQADCLPDPAVSGGTTTCTGTIIGGVTLSVPNTVTIASGATLTASAGDSAAFTATSAGVSSSTTYVTLNVSGHINGGAGAGVLGLAGTSTGYPASRLDITVDATGVVDGATGILLQSTAGNTYGQQLSYVDNAGSIGATSGPAIVAADPGLTGFGRITNRLGGFIGGIYGAVQYLDNAGTIDGGANSAFAFDGSVGYVASPYSITNTGTMTSSNATATLNLPHGLNVTNSSAISNTGAGAAIVGGDGYLTVNNRSGGSIISASGAAIRQTSGSLSLNNDAGAVVTGGGPIAIQAETLTLVNRGTINGSIVSTSTNGNFYSTIDTVGGVINGDVTLGVGNDLLKVGYDSLTNRLLGITGQVNGGFGTNTLQVSLNGDQSLDTVFSQTSLPANFQQTELLLNNGLAATLTGDTPDGVRIMGQGSVVSSGAMTGGQTVLSLGSSFYATALNFRNTGSITTVYFGGAYALDVANGVSVINDGAITSNSLGVNFLSYYRTLVNNGTITARTVALNTSYSSFQNNGTLRALDGTGVIMWGPLTSTNTGTIEGTFVAVQGSGSAVLVNSGNISATKPNGSAFSVDSYFTLDNRAGGVISGGRALRREATYGFYVSVLNAGVINGDIDLRTPGFSTNDSYVDNGGTLNGSLYFAGGPDTLTTDLSRFKDGRLVGITGTVDGGAGVDTLVLNVKTDATATVALPTNFEALSFQISNNAAGTVTVSQPLTGMLRASGGGKLDLQADITGVDATLMTLNNPSSPTTGGLSVVSRGALTLTQATGSDPAVQIYGQANFENAGALTVNGLQGAPFVLTAIQNGGAVKNSGTITLANAAGVSGAVSFTNTGVLKVTGAGTGVISVHVIDNSGTIQTDGRAISDTVYGYNGTTPTTTINNTGTISSGDTAVYVDYRALTLTNQAGAVISSSTGTAIRSGASDDRVENYGAIIGTVSLGDGNDTFVQWVGGSLTGVVDGGNGLDTLVIDSMGGGSISSNQFTNFENFKQIGGGSLVYEGVFNGGITLDGGGVSVLAGTTLTTPVIVGVYGSSVSGHVSNAGTIIGSIYLANGADTVENRGAITGDVRLGEGDDTFTAGAGSTVSGAIDGGDGVDTYIAELNGDQTGLRSRANFERLGVTGSGALTLALDQDWQSINLAGANLDLQQGAFTVSGVFGGDGSEAVSLDRDVAKVNLGGGADALTLGGDSFAGVYAGGAGADTLTFTTANTVVVNGSVSGFETVSLTGTRMDVSGVLGATGDSLTFAGGGGQTLSILSGGTLAGTVDLGAGDDVFHLAAGGQLVGTVLGGAGNDLVAIDLTADLSLRGDQLQQFENLQVTGTGALNFTGGAAKFDHLVTSSKDMTVAANASLDVGDLKFDGAANTMTINGAFSGALDLGAGDDTLRLTTGGSFTGSANGGAGSDRLELALGGTDAVPIALGGAVFSGFETLSLQSGVVSVAGNYGFDTIQVSNGRLIGLAGSHLAASNITVAQGATFGSAGAVTGNIAVAGTLSPGASPGTMTVTGNVALTSGSTALFEFTPTVSDKLLVSGSVTIAQGSTLKVTGAASLTPGRTLDMIVADGGISGSFSTIDGAQGLNLHVKQSATRLQVLGLFTTDTAFSPQVSGVISTLNTALIDDKVSAPLVAALSVLVDPATGKSSPKALDRLTPQAYASASQLAIEDGLSIVDATRAQARFAPESPGLFAFGQAIANHRTLDGDSAAGIAQGKISGEGILSGVGYGVGSAWAGGFVGYLNGRERIGDLDARTSTDSFVAGVLGNVRVGGVQLGLMAARDRADAQTRRSAPGGAGATGDYKLKSWTADINLSYCARLNDNWALQPRLGGSYVGVTRSALAEQGGGAFALALRDEKTATWFVDGQIELLGGQAAGKRLQPYASVGFRTRVAGDAATASASLAGLSAPLVADGLDRDGTSAIVGAGAAYDVTSSLKVSATYSGEFGDGGRQGVVVGLNWTF